MKTKMMIAMLLACILVLPACQASPKSSTKNKSTAKDTIASSTASTTHSSIHDILKADEEWPKEERAAQCLSAAMDADTAEEAADWLCEKSQDLAEQFVNNYQGYPVSVEVEYITKFNGYDIFRCVIRNTETNEELKDYCLFDRDGDQYRLCINGEEQQKVYNKFVCKTCSGAGCTTQNGIVCALCGGTGVQQMPYFDPITQMTMMQTTGCGGCGGSGWTTLPSTTICVFCGGDGWKFD